MTRFPYDQFAKDYLKELLQPLGQVETSRKVPAQIREIDVYFVPPPQSTKNTKNTIELGLLGKFAAEPALVEPFRNAATIAEIRSCMNKLFDIFAELKRQTKSEKNRLAESELPRLWILSPTAATMTVITNDDRFQPINLFEYEKLAKEHLSQMTLDYYSSGAWDEITLRDNHAAFERVKLRPRILIDVSDRNLTTSILGQPLQLPLLIAPMAFQCLAHPDGEVATALAAASSGVGMVLSTLATKSIEEVATACDKFPNSLQWFQLYSHKDRGLTRALVEKAYKAGYKALCLTVDAPVLGQRETDRRNEFALPPDLHLANLATISGLNISQEKGESGLFTYFAQQLNPAVTWHDLEWLQSLSPLPLVIKGILRGDDAVRAVESGAKAIVVSNHGGRQLDGAIASLDALAEIVAAVDGKVEVLLDGGIRRGTDILKALALGAKAVLIGRPILWGLAVAGQVGVSHVISLLQDELNVGMALSGCAKLEDIDPSLLTLPRL